MRRPVLSSICLLALAASALGAILPGDVAAPVARRSASIDAAAVAATAGLEWFALDMHLHTDHSSDGGLFHQQEKDQRNQDTFLDEQRDQALRTGMDGVAFTDHRNFGQHFDPGYDLRDNPLVDDQLLITGEEWGGGRHGTAFGMLTKVEHGPTDRIGCGMAEMTLEVAAQDGLLGMAHPSDGGADACMTELVDFPLSHIEALRGGDGAPQEAGIMPGGNGSDSEYYHRLVEAGGRVAAINGSDNHFKQVWAGPSGPGGSATYALVADASQAGIVEAVRAQRTIAGWGAANVRLTTLLDADRDGTFDAVTGGWAEPAGATVTLAVRVERGPGHAVQVWDGSGAIVAQATVTGIDETIAFDLPVSPFYRATVMTVEAARFGLPDPFNYVDTLILNSTPVWTSAPAAGGARPVVGNATLSQLGEGEWSGLADLAVAADGTMHAVWQEREGTTYRVMHRRSVDGQEWTPSVTLASGDVRTPTVTAEGDRVVVAWEAHDRQVFGGTLELVESDDAGRSFGAARPVAGTTNAARPVLAAAEDAVHLVWQQQAGDGTWAIHHQRVGEETTIVSSAEPFSGGMTQFAVPPRELMHIPASVNPTVAVDGDRVVIAWEDNREDQTPGRSGSPDDWGVFGVVSVDGGVTFSPDGRWTPRRVQRDDPSDPEGIVGNPALSPDLAIAGDGTVHLAFTDTFQSVGYTDVWMQSSPDGGLNWAAPVRIAPAGQWAYHPQVEVTDDGTVVAVWQQSDDPTWSLARATSTNDGQTFSTAAALTTGGRYSGWPELAGGHAVLTAETPEGFSVHTMSALP